MAEMGVMKQLYTVIKPIIKLKTVKAQKQIFHE